MLLSSKQSALQHLQLVHVPQTLRATGVHCLNLSHTFVLADQSMKKFWVSAVKRQTLVAKGNDNIVTCWLKLRAS